MNNPELLAQLRDIHTPEPVGWWPLAPGWWILMALALVGLVALLVWLRSRRNRTTAITESLRQLKQLPETGNKQNLVTVLQLFRRVALVYSSREQVATISLDALAQRLAHQQNIALHPSSLELMRDAQYRPDTQIATDEWQNLKTDLERLLPALADDKRQPEANHV